MEEKVEEKMEQKPEEKPEQKKKRDNEALSVLLAVGPFALLLFFIVVGLTTSFIASMRLGTVLTGLAFFVILVLATILIVVARKHKKFKIFLYLLDVLLLVGVYALIGRNAANSFDADVYLTQGNNSYTSFYSKGYGGPTYGSVEEANAAVLGGKAGSSFEDYKELYRVSKEPYIWTFYQEGKRVVMVELYEEAGRYYDRGTLSLVYSRDSSSSGNYSNKETIRADAVHSLYYGISEKGRSCPAWGVAESENIGEVSINGVKADHVEAITGYDGETYYFWVIEEIGDIETITIEGEFE